MIGLVVLTAPFVFRGGDLGALAQRLAKTTDRTTVALVQGERTYVSNERHPGYPQNPVAQVRPFDLDLDAVVEDKDLPRILRVKARVEGKAAPGELALWDPVWRRETLVPINGKPPLPKDWQDPKPGFVRVAEGAVTAKLPPQTAYAVGEIAGLGWSKPVRVHWLLARMLVVPVASGAREATFLDCLARAVSGRLVDTGREFRIDLDPEAFRVRALATLQAEADRRGTLTPILAASYRFRYEAWRGFDAAAIQDLYHERRMTIARDVPVGSPLDAAIGQWASLYKEKAANDPPTVEGGVREMRDSLAKIDWSRSPRVFASQDTGLSVGWHALAGGTVFP